MNACEGMMSLLGVVVQSIGWAVRLVGKGGRWGVKGDTLPKSAKGLSLSNMPEPGD